MSTRALFVSVVLVALGCGVDLAVDPHPPPPGTYECAEAECATSFIIGEGTIDNGDVQCGAFLHGTTIWLSCPAGRNISASWLPNDDGTVTTDVLDVVYGELESAGHKYRRKP